MPEICRFFGIVIRMFWDDHNPPHFHAFYAGEEALVSIHTLSLFAGQLPPRALGLGSSGPRCTTRNCSMTGNEHGAKSRCGKSIRFGSWSKRHHAGHQPLTTDHRSLITSPQ